MWKTSFWLWTRQEAVIFLSLRTFTAHDRHALFAKCKKPNMLVALVCTCMHLSTWQSSLSLPFEELSQWLGRTWRGRNCHLQGDQHGCAGSTQHGYRTVFLSCIYKVAKMCSLTWLPSPKWNMQNIKTSSISSSILSSSYSSSIFLFSSQYSCTFFFLCCCFMFCTGFTVGFRELHCNHADFQPTTNCALTLGAFGGCSDSWHRMHSMCNTMHS